MGNTINYCRQSGMTSLVTYYSLSLTVAFVAVYPYLVHNRWQSTHNITESQPIFFGNVTLFEELRVVTGFWSNEWFSIQSSLLITSAVSFQHETTQMVCRWPKYVTLSGTEIPGYCLQGRETYED